MAVALIESGMKYEDAIQFIRQYVHLSLDFFQEAQTLSSWRQLLHSYEWILNASSQSLTLARLPFDHKAKLKASNTQKIRSWPLKLRPLGHAYIFSAIFSPARAGMKREISSHFYLPCLET